MPRVALRFAGLLIVVLTILRIPDYLSRFLVAPDRSFLLFLMIAIVPLAISLAAGIALWRYADALWRLINGAKPEPSMQISEQGSHGLLAIGITLIGAFLLVEGASDLAYWIGRYFQLKQSMPHVQVELGEEFVSIFSTTIKILLSAGFFIYGRKAVQEKGRH